MLSVAMVAIASCSRTPNLEAQVQSAGGQAVLMSECQAILDEHQKTQREFWKPDDSALPPTIAALQPQVVQVRRYEGLPMVDIQLSGGFSHRGLMVVLTNTTPEFVPRKSTWRVRKIGDGVFEYRE
jgi:hypothetical protein